MFQFFRWFQRVKFGVWSVTLHKKYAEFFLFMQYMILSGTFTFVWSGWTKLRIDAQD